MQIRRLTAEDAAVYREVRLRALREHPEAFATSYEEELERAREEYEARLASSQQLTIGGFEDDRLLCIATLVRGTKPRLRHRATLVAMYVAPEARRRQLGRRLLEHVLEAARAWQLTDVSLAVTVGNDAARRLYASAGFICYGVEPRSLRVEGRFHDVELMNLALDS